MLTLARTHTLDRAQFGRPLASFQAVRHRLAETFVLLGSARELTREAGTLLIKERYAPRPVNR